MNQDKLKTPLTTLSQDVLKRWKRYRKTHKGNIWWVFGCFCGEIMRSITLIEKDLKKKVSRVSD